jgi:hypothetical protein
MQYRFQSTHRQARAQSFLAWAWTSALPPHEFGKKRHTEIQIAMIRTEHHSF